MKSLPIVWQRLVSSAGTTCPRCQGTHEEVQSAVERLKLALEPLGITPALEIRELDQAAFLNQPFESNRIWICGKPMEEWVEGRVGRSRCCGECGNQDCRTVEVGGTTYEVIPEALLVRAGLTAASRLLDPTLTS
ncbi:MAG: DUF2703 domain-containing protein [Pseudomonadota bacterium]|nr:DUF2703 domain-containing protein [Pseudomonadota bacterium]